MLSIFAKTDANQESSRFRDAVKQDISEADG